MAITLGGIALPDDLLWVDEFDWSPTVQSTDYSLTGSLIIQTGTRQAGRPITLQGGSDHGWISRATLEQLYGLNGTTKTLVLHDLRTFSVQWRHGDKPIEASQVIGYSDVTSTDYYDLTLRLMVV